MIGFLASKFRFLLSFLWLTVFSTTAVAQSAAPRAVDSLIGEGIRANIEQNFQKAFTLFYELHKRLPNDPRPLFYMAATLQAKMMDFEEYSEENRFMALIDSTILFADRWIKSDSLKALGLYFKGASISYRGFYFGQRKRYFRALRDAISGVGYLQRAVQLNSELYDAYLGIGVYKYWRSRLTRVLRFLPFFPDQREEGIRMIETALQKSTHGRDVAVNSLIWIQIDRRRYGAAIQAAKAMLRKFPGSRYFLWPLAAAYWRSGNMEKAIEVYQEILDSIRSEEQNNHYNEVICLLRISQAYEALKYFSRACSTAQEALALPLSPDVAKRLKPKRKELQEIVSHCVDNSRPHE